MLNMLMEAGLENDDCGFKTGGRNTKKKNLHHPDGTTLTAENAKDLTVLIMKIKKHKNKNETQIVVHFQMLDMIWKK